MYDTSGPYTDPNDQSILQKVFLLFVVSGVIERGDVEEYVGREIKPEDNGYKDKNDSSKTYISRFKGNRFELKKGKM